MGLFGKGPFAENFPQISAKFLPTCRRISAPFPEATKQGSEIRVPVPGPPENFDGAKISGIKNGVSTSKSRQQTGLKAKNSFPNKRNFLHICAKFPQNFLAKDLRYTTPCQDHGKGGLSLTGVAFMMVLTGLAVLESALPSFCLSYKIQHNEATVAV